jgi:hypothetical protein
MREQRVKQKGEETRGKIRGKQRGEETRGKKGKAEGRD